MNFFITTLALLAVSFSYTYAWDEAYEKKQTPTKMEEREVVSWNHGLEIREQNGIMNASWNQFPSDSGFDWYKLVYSTTNTSPVYPYDKTVFIGSRDQIEASFKLQKWAENHYIRLCAVVLNDDYSKDRYCWGTKVFSWKISAKPTQYKKEYEYEKTEKKEVLTYNVLSWEMMSKISWVVDTFIEKIESRNLEDEEVIKTINSVIDKLQKYKYKEKYAAIVGYMEELLQDYLLEYEDPISDLEEIFQNF